MLRADSGLPGETGRASRWCDEDCGLEVTGTATLGSDRYKTRLSKWGGVIGTEQVEYPKELVESIQALSEIVFAQGDVSTTVQRIAKLAVHAIEGAELCSVSLVQGGKISTIGATSDIVQKLDSLQYETDEGPCLSSIREHGMFHIADMQQDETWPSFSKRAAAETGVRSMLAFVLGVGEDSLGALNLMSTKVDTFDQDDVSTGALFAVHAAGALRNAMDSADAELSKAELSKGLETRKLIGQATGLLMAQEGLTSDEAFDRLVRVSQNANIKVREIAERYVDAWETKAAPPS